jgi:hypothetical protein
VFSALSVAYGGQLSDLKECEGVRLAYGQKFESVVFEFLVMKISET